MSMVLLFGGSFNPPTIGHVLTISYIVTTEDVSEIVVAPTFQHPFGKDLVSFDHRVKMCELAFESIGHPGLSVSSVERELGGVSFTLRTVKHIRRFYADDTEVRWVAGSDCEQQKEVWGDWSEINKITPFYIFDRAGYPTSETHRPVIYDVSSTEVRNRLRDKQGINKIVPRRVVEYIQDHNLYQPT
jgi:nicotinate-nucleotide adenylyltransferase